MAGRSCEFVGKNRVIKQGTLAEVPGESGMEGNPDAADGKKALWWRPVVLLAAITTIFVLGHLVGLGDHLGALRDWIASLGAWGPVVFVMTFAVAAVLAIPGSILVVSAGALFGSFLGVIKSRFLGPHCGPRNDSFRRECR